MGSGHSRRADPVQGRRPAIRGAIASFLACGTALSSPETADYPNDELLVNSSEHVLQKKLKKCTKKNSNLSFGNGKDLFSINTESMVSSEGHLVAGENHPPNVGTSNFVDRNKRKCLSENRHCIPPHQSNDNSRCGSTASTSYLNQQSPYSVSTNEMSDRDSMNGANCKRNGDSLQNDQGCISSTVCSPCHGEPLLGEVSVINKVSDEVNLICGSPLDHHMVVREDLAQEVTPTGLGFVAPDMEQNRQDGNLLQVGVVSVSSNVLPTSSDIITPDARRSSGRLFLNALSWHSSWNHAESTTTALSPGNSGHLISHNRLLEFSGDSHSDEIEDNSGSHGDETQDSNELHWNSGPEIQGLHGTLDPTHHGPVVCPRGIHGNGPCSCFGSSNEESGSRAGISRIVMLAEALFEVLDQIQQHPMSPSLPRVLLRAEESVVDSFPVKSHSKAERLEDVSQCYICLGEYEEGEEIRVLPCHHEFHRACVDKWLKEIHGVCPLCRRSVGDRPHV